MDEESDLSTLSSLLENVSQSEEVIRMVTSVILRKCSIHGTNNLRRMTLRKNCLRFSGIEECSGRQQNTDKIVLNHPHILRIYP